MSWRERMVRKFKARFRMDLRIVCEESAEMGPYDYHDYRDDVYGEPCHFVMLTCKRCGKPFLM